MSSMDQHIQTFLEEADELLGEIEDAVLELEANPDSSELVDRVFRTMHTIKGSGAMFGFDTVADFTHHVETALDQVREGNLGISKELIDLVLASRDHIVELLAAARTGAEPDVAAGQWIIDHLAALKPGSGEPEQEAAADRPAATDDGAMRSYHLRVHLQQGVMQTGMDPLAILDELVGLGEAVVIGHCGDVPALEEIDPELCYLWWDVTIATEHSEDALRDVFIFVEDGSEIIVELVDEGDANIDVVRPLGEILAARGDTSRDSVHEALGQQKRLGELLVESGAADEDKVRAALAEQQFVRKQKEKAQAASIRVAADKLDMLVNLVGELVITQAQLTQASARSDDPDLATPVENVQRLTGELRDLVLNVRMLAIGTTFSRFQRLVRDLSTELDKEIDLVTIGGETEVDKTVIERLGDPMVHLIRNCIDHGIEEPDVRLAAGKSRRGTVTLEACRAGSEVLVSVTDDGKGLDPRRIAEKAVEKGIISSTEGLSDEEALNLIFAPGFSTAGEVTEVSGRGVGMDVVKREIEKLRGSVSLHSRLGEGTTVTLKLPLTMAIIDGLLTEAGGYRYVIQLTEVQEVVELTKRDIGNAGGRHIISVRDEIIPYVRLREVFRMEDSAADIEQVVIVESSDKRVGIVVDEVIGDLQTVIKPLPKNFGETEGVAGATILGDGAVALILDIPHVVRCARSEEDAFMEETVLRIGA